MLKDSDPPKETAAELAKRKWRNHQLRQKIVEQRERKPKLAAAEPGPADVITNSERRDGPINRLESKFAKYIRSILQGHIDENILLYKASLAHQKRRLLREKLRRLEAAQEASNG